MSFLSGIGDFIGGAVKSVVGGVTEIATAPFKAAASITGSIFGGGRRGGNVQVNNYYGSEGGYGGYGNYGSYGGPHGPHLPHRPHGPHRSMGPGPQAHPRGGFILAGGRPGSPAVPLGGRRGPGPIPPRHV